MKLKYTMYLANPLEFSDDEARTKHAAEVMGFLNFVVAPFGVRTVIQPARMKKVAALGRGGPRVVFVAGCVKPANLPGIVKEIHRRGCKPIVIVDALQIDSQSNEAEMHEALVHLNEMSVQLCHMGEVTSLLNLNWNDLHMHRFAKADNTSSVAVFFEGGKKILAVKRKRNPDKGKWALPGGFLNCQLETIEECGAREVGEETKVRVLPTELRLVDVRSSPRRDSRQHVVDHGYAWFVPKDREQEIYDNMEAADDAEKLEVLDTEWLLQQDIAFDHRQIIERGLAMAA